MVANIGETVIVPGLILRLLKPRTIIEGVANWVLSVTLVTMTDT
jgi:hypothetical protein